MSSMLPARTIDGIADKTPVKNRPIIVAAMKGTAPISMQNNEKRNVAAT